jgi:hypothetical protein
MLWYYALMLGCLGGTVPDVLRIIAARYKRPPDYLWQPFFWIGLAMLVALGGLCTVLYGPTRALEALSIGYSAPELVSRLLGSNKPTAARRRQPSEVLSREDYGTAPPPW